MKKYYITLSRCVTIFVGDLQIIFTKDSPFAAPGQEQVSIRECCGYAEYALFLLYFEKYSKGMTYRSSEELIHDFESLSFEDVAKRVRAENSTINVEKIGDREDQIRLYWYLND